MTTILPHNAHLLNLLVEKVFLCLATFLNTLTYTTMSRVDINLTLPFIDIEHVLNNKKLFFTRQFTKETFKFIRILTF